MAELVSEGYPEQHSVKDRCVFGCCEEIKVKDERIAEFEALLQATRKRARFLEAENGSLQEQVRILIAQSEAYNRPKTSGSSTLLPSQE